MSWFFGFLGSIFLHQVGQCGDDEVKRTADLRKHFYDACRCYFPISPSPPALVLPPSSSPSSSSFFPLYSFIQPVESFPILGPRAIPPFADQDVKLANLRPHVPSEPFRNIFASSLVSNLQASFGPSENSAVALMLQRNVANDCEEKDRDKVCIVCITNARRVVFVPCGHRQFCFTCSVELWRCLHPKCPSCRTPIGTIVQTFD